LLDDLTANAIQIMKTAGFAPALVVETSPGNFQVWLKHPSELLKDLSTAVARRLAKDFGADPGAADWRHFGRLAGFTNRKECHRQANGLFPFVRIWEASGGEYPKGETFIEQVKDDTQKEALRRQVIRVAPPVSRRDGPLKNIDSFRSNPVYGGDGTRIDLAYAIYALSRGCSSVEVAAAIRTRSLVHKGTEKRQAEYVDRTINKAYQLLDRRGNGRSPER
jgi:hypothetical protein